MREFCITSWFDFLITQVIISLADRQTFFFRQSKTAALHLSKIIPGNYCRRQSLFHIACRPACHLVSKARGATDENELSNPDGSSEPFIGSWPGCGLQPQP